MRTLRLHASGSVAVHGTPRKAGPCAAGAREGANRFSNVNRAGSAKGIPPRSTLA